ncbi:peptide ABC transporter permease [Dehalococcoides mccartyi]|jgi:oligopeptide transport system permease protein|uniref:ABC transporter permease n=1 Tax=Dehalococcoides mccartyi TaxID=61435 RepID=UPI0002B76A08|nr:ABC transporter permease [Dehalococcoides mccartyi]AGG06597.1 PepT transporter family, permease [Dehalococcoides mccartyi DCMB5]AQX74822.1 peptide ABC transporter permease [Dehalococcoides mccartyi]AQY73399.1 peptide ABC transporter permease [Dehalococcoides mccartyi]
MFNLFYRAKKEVTESETSSRQHHTLWGDAWVRLRRNKLAVLGGSIILLLALAAILAPLYLKYDFATQNYDAILVGPSTEHLLGTDELGRDVFSRLIYGARTSLAVGLFTQLVVLMVGLPIGAIAAAAGGRVDNLLMRFVDIMYAFPDILLIILLRAIFGGSIFMIFLAIGLVAWVGIARLVRGQILSVKQRDFVAAARAMGGSGAYVTLRHLLPNSLGPIIVAITFNIPRAIFAEAALSYIGIGVRPPTPSWGTMIADGNNVIYAAPYLVIFPAIAIAILMLSFTFLGDGLRDALDPRLRR